jgi:hypothetical protein
VPYYSASAQYWYRAKKVGVVPARSRKSCIVQAVCQVVFTDVLIVGRLDGNGQSFAPIGLHKIDTVWVQKACREFSYKINRITAVIGVILAFTGKKMFNFN